MARSYEFTKEQVLEATKGSMGIISQIARNLGGCDWHTAQKYVNRWAETRQAYTDECERQLDLSESKMLQAIGAGDGPMIRFHLSTKGRNRGYVIRQETEVTGKDGEPLTIRYVNDWRDYSTKPAHRAADSKKPGQAVQLAVSGPPLEEDDSGDGDSS